MSTAATDLRASAGRLREEADRLEALAARLRAPIQKPPMVRPDYEKYGWHVTDQQHRLAPGVVDFLVVHHDGPASGDVNKQAIDIHRYHVRPEAEGGRGFAAIGYNWWIQKSGLIEVARGEEHMGAHADYRDPKTGALLCQYNRRSLAACLSGHYEINAAGPPPEQWEAAVRLFAWLRQQFPAARILSHRELPGWEKLTACPGMGINMVRLRFDVDTKLRGG